MEIGKGTQKKKAGNDYSGYYHKTNYNEHRGNDFAGGGKAERMGGWQWGVMAR